MKVERRRGLAEAPHATGDVVVIDVLRAFTTAAFAFGSGASEIVLVSTPEETLELKQKYPRAKLCGEIGGRPIDGFDFGNSPAQIARANLKGRTLILRSTNGTQGVVLATKAERVWLGSLPVAGVTCELLAAKAKHVTLLALGSAFGSGELDGPEDDACGDLMEELLAGRTPDLARIREKIQNSPAGKRAVDPVVDWITPEDLECALDYDFFGFAMVMTREKGVCVARVVGG